MAYIDRRSTGTYLDKKLICRDPHNEEAQTGNEPDDLIETCNNPEVQGKES